MENEINYSRMAKAIEFVAENFKDQPKLEEVAESVYMSPFHFQRMFTEWAGVSPKQFLQFVSANYAKNLLQNKATLFEAALETGLSGTGRLHDLFLKVEAMTPGEYKNGGSSLEIDYSFQNTPFGRVLVATTQKGICNLEFVEDESQSLVELGKQWYNARIRENAIKHVDLIENIFWKKSDEKVALNLKGTEFQLKVWEALLRIPEGSVTNYQEIANQIGNPKASRAVGSAIGSNPVGFIIPCHRVIKKAGGIGEYHWGVERKRSIIAWEKCQILAQNQKVA